MEILDNLNISFDKVAVVSPVTMAHWKAPNFFNECDHRLAATLDWNSPTWMHRSIQEFKELIPLAQLEWCEYLSDAIFVINKSHREFCREVLNYLYSFNANAETRELMNEATSHDKTVFNLVIKKLNLEVKHLQAKYNIAQPVMRYALREDAYRHLTGIWQFNNMEHPRRVEEMAKFWSLKDS